MAPLKPVKKDASDQRLQTILELAKKASKSLKEYNDHLPGLEEDVTHAIKRLFPLTSPTTLAANVSTLDSLGCEIWNGATNILRQNEYEDTKRDDFVRRIVWLRTFAFLLLDAAHNGASERRKDRNHLIRNLKTGLKACWSCLDNDEFELALKVLERCAGHVSAVEESPLVQMAGGDENKDQKNVLDLLTADFYLARMTHAQKSERLDSAEHFFSKFTNSRLADSSVLLEKSSRRCYETGKALSKNTPIDPAIKWLQRALSSLNACDIESLSPDAGELRLAITAKLVDILLSLKQPDSLQRARGLVEELHTTYGLGNRLAFQLMQLKILLVKEPVDMEQLHDSLSRVLRCAVLTEHSLKKIMQAIHSVRKTSTEVACQVMEELITDRLLPDLPADSDAGGALQDWTEKICITHIHFLISSSEAEIDHSADRLLHVFDAIVQTNEITFSPRATHAAQALIWKATGTADARIADKWCRMLQHPLFSSAGQVNKARIGRRAMAMALAKDEFELARAAFYQIPSNAQNEAMTRYLAFKLALRSNDDEFAIESLNVVAHHAGRDSTYLYACILEAQQSQMRHIAIAALQVILDKHPPGIHLPTLQRCIARMLIEELDKQKEKIDEIAAEVVHVFEDAAANIPTLRKSSDEQCKAEVEWWSKNAYNLSLKFCSKMRPENLVGLLGVCTKFLDAYPNDTGPMHDDDLRKRKAICHFLAAASLIVVGRSHEERSEDGLGRYLQARREIGAFVSLYQDLNTQDQSQNWPRRMFELQKFDLECILNLHQWDEVGSCLQACLNLEEVDSWDALADIVLVIHEQSEIAKLNDERNSRMMELLNRIINETWRKKQDIGKAARWLRLSYTVDLADGNGEFALKLLGQAAYMAKKGCDGRNELFPETELQWIAITAFNRSVDMLSSGLHDECMSWIEGALELARYAGDNGALHANLTSKKGEIMQRMKGAVA